MHITTSVFYFSLSSSVINYSKNIPLLINLFIKEYHKHIYIVVMTQLIVKEYIQLKTCYYQVILSILNHV